MKGFKSQITCFAFALFLLAGLHSVPRSWAGWYEGLDNSLIVRESVRPVASSEHKQHFGLASLPIVVAPATQLTSVTTQKSQEQALSQQLPKVQPGKVTLSRAVVDGWWGTVHTDLRQHEYHISWQNRTGLEDPEAAWQAPNRAQNLRTYFTPKGICVIPRTKAKSSWVLGLELQKYGYPKNLHSVPNPALEPEGSRIEYRRGNLREWYVNDRRGLEHGISLSVPPDPATAATLEPVLLQMKLTGDMTPVLSTDRQRVEFLAADGGLVLQYAQLHAVDATGRTLPAQLMLSDRILTIQVSAQDAVYPILIDPTLSTPTWIAVGQQGEADFGWSVAGAGDVNGDGADDLIVGAPHYDTGVVDGGAAFIYYGSRDEADISNESGHAIWGTVTGMRLGMSVASAGNVNGDLYDDVIVGAPWYTDQYEREGAAAVYSGSTEGLSFLWGAVGNQKSAYFGGSVASAGDVNGDGYGDIMVGASNWDTDKFDAGGAFVWHGSANGLTASPQWSSYGDQASTGFGSAVASAGNVNGDDYDDVIVGAPHYHDGDQVPAGAAFVYHGSAQGLSNSAGWRSESDQDNARFGWAVSHAGDVNGDGKGDVIVGAPFYDNGQIDEGAVFIYLGSDSGLNPLAARRLEGDQAEASYGSSIAGVGDVDGDGFSDFMVGAYLYDHNEENEGRVFVYFGSKEGVPEVPNEFTAESDQAEAGFGFSVASADMNGDGTNSLIVGIPWYGNSELLPTAIGGRQEASQSRRRGAVQSVSPEFTRFIFVSDIKAARDQWHLGTMSASRVWNELGIRGTHGIVIAVIDQGVQTDHRFLRNNIMPGWDFYDNDQNPMPVGGDDTHGTRLAGLAAAHGAPDVVGVCPGCGILPVRIGRGKALVQAEVFAKAIRYAAERADVLLLAVGLDRSRFSAAINEAINYATTSANGKRGRKGSVVVGASGNHASRYRSYKSSVVSWALRDIPPGRYRFRWLYERPQDTRADPHTTSLAWVRFPGEEEPVTFENGTLPAGWRTNTDNEGVRWTVRKDPVHADEGYKHAGKCLTHAARAGEVDPANANNRPSPPFLEVERQITQQGKVLYHAWWPRVGGTLRVLVENTETRESWQPQFPPGLLERLTPSREVNAAVSYPAANPMVLAVGASSDHDCRSNYSQFGPGLDVVAPSDGGPLNHGMLTTELGEKVKTGTFGGTSAAAALAAGLAGLMLSANSELTQDEVRRIIMETADKIGPEPYDVTGRNDRYGFGRINAFEAVQEAMRRR